MKYINTERIAYAEIIEPGKKHFDFEKEQYGWRLILYFDYSPSITIELDSREQCQKKAEELNLILI